LAGIALPWAVENPVDSQTRYGYTVHIITREACNMLKDHIGVWYFDRNYNCA